MAHVGSSRAPDTKSSPGLRINSLPKWFHAWNQFLLANAVYHMDVVLALLIYQARICQYAEHHDFNSVVYYDGTVCTRIAGNPDIHWDDQFPDELNSLIGGGEKYRTAAAALCLCVTSQAILLHLALWEALTLTGFILSPELPTSPGDIGRPVHCSTAPLWSHCQFSSPNANTVLWPVQ